jgi:hypothetical protein
MPKKPSYATVVIETVRKSGMASRAHIAKQAKSRGCDKSTLLKNAIKKESKNGTIEFSDKSYILGAKARAQLKQDDAERYTKALEQAQEARDMATKQKAAVRERAEAQYAANTLAARTGPASSWNRGVSDADESYTKRDRDDTNHGRKVNMLAVALQN